MLYYAPTIFEGIGFESDSAATLATVGLGCVKVGSLSHFSFLITVHVTISCLKTHKNLKKVLEELNTSSIHKANIYKIKSLSCNFIQSHCTTLNLQTPMDI